MEETNFTSSDERVIENGLRGYGCVVSGGDADEREDALREYFNNPFIVIKCKHIDSVDEFIRRVIELSPSERDYGPNRSLGLIEMRRAIGETNTGLLISEFDSMEKEVQRGIAQLMKGLAEREDWEGEIGYTCMNSDAVVKAESDLRLRVKSVSID